MTATIELPPDDRYVIFSEGGAGQPNRLIIQFKDMADMNKAHASLRKSLYDATRAYVDRRVALDQYV